MIKASEAKRISFENPTFARKTELYKLVEERIEAQARAGKDHVILNEEENAALEAELKELGYSRFKTTSDNSFTTTVGRGIGLSINSDNFIVQITGQHKYYFA